MILREYTQEVLVGTRLDIDRDYEQPRMVVCEEGCVEVVFYAELPNMDAGGPGREFLETYRAELCPQHGTTAIEIPPGVWHAVVAKEKSKVRSQALRAV